MPPHTEAYKGRLVNLNWHQRTSWWLWGSKYGHCPIRVSNQRPFDHWPYTLTNCANRANTGAKRNKYKWIDFTRKFTVRKCSFATAWTQFLYIDSMRTPRVNYKKGQGTIFPAGSVSVVQPLRCFALVLPIHVFYRVTSGQCYQSRLQCLSCSASFIESE
jgi:hypothetical protein